MPVVDLKQIRAERSRQYSRAKSGTHLKRQRRHDRVCIDFTVPLLEARNRFAQLLIISRNTGLEYFCAVMAKEAKPME